MQRRLSTLHTLHRLVSTTITTLRPYPLFTPVAKFLLIDIHPMQVRVFVCGRKTKSAALPLLMQGFSIACVVIHCWSSRHTQANYNGGRKEVKLRF
jgi:hypothetical protein